MPEASTLHLDGTRVGTRLSSAGNLFRQLHFKKLNFRVHGERASSDRAMTPSVWIDL